ncbi:hypothetical protein [Listeria costaricensis]|uniref:hypothetical protein n=1 Tax=Listeria costaricensis TaxID=2026604 RepID=UPI000C06A69A|nr:hypothetical protein [Listeria costaricensis]
MEIEPFDSTYEWFKWDKDVKRTKEELFAIIMEIDEQFDRESWRNQLALHPARVDLMAECLGLVEDRFFLPKTRAEVEAYIEIAKARSRGERTMAEIEPLRTEILKALTEPPHLDPPKCKIVGYLADDEEYMDWSWVQYFEMMLYPLLKYGVSKEDMAAILRKHYPQAFQTK